MTERTMVDVLEDAAVLIFGFMIALLLGVGYFIDPANLFDESLDIVTRSVYASVAGVAFFLGWVWPRHAFACTAVAMIIFLLAGLTARPFGHHLDMPALVPLFWIVAPGAVPFFLAWGWDILEYLRDPQNPRFVGE